MHKTPILTRRIYEKIVVWKSKNVLFYLSCAIGGIVVLSTFAFFIVKAPSNKDDSSQAQYPSSSISQDQTLVASEYDKHYDDIDYCCLKLNTIPTTYFFHCGNRWIKVEAKNVTYRYVLHDNASSKVEVHIDKNDYTTATITQPVNDNQGK